MPNYFPKYLCKLIHLETVSESPPFLFIFTNTWYCLTLFIFTYLEGETWYIIYSESASSYLRMRLRLNMFSFNLWLLYISSSTKYPFIGFVHFSIFFFLVGGLYSCRRYIFLHNNLCLLYV